MSGSNRIEFANNLRGLAALSVVIAHLGGGFWFGHKTVAYFVGVPTTPLEAPTFAYLLGRIPYFHFGAFGVAIFFLISGLVIPYSINRLSRIQFLAARAVRLFPTYAVCFSIILLFLAIAHVYFDAPWHLAASDILLHYIPGLRAVTGSRHIDSVIWTLEVELLFYGLCAVFTGSIRKRSIVVFAAPVLFAAVFLLSQTISDIRLPTGAMEILARAPYVAFMFIGLAMYQHHSGSLSTTKTCAISIVLLVLFYFTLGLAAPTGQGIYLFRIYMGALLLFVLLYQVPGLLPSNAVLAFFADISYPLYVVHAVSGYSLLLIMLDLGFIPIAALATTVTLLISIATAVHHFVELPTRRWSSAIGASSRTNAATASSATKAATAA